MRIGLAGGEASDHAAADELIALPLTKPRMMLADKGYNAAAVRTTLLMQASCQ